MLHTQSSEGLHSDSKLTARSWTKGQGIAMESKAWPSIPSTMVHCKGPECCPSFSDWNNTFLFFFTPSPWSILLGLVGFSFFFSPCLTEVSFQPTKGLAAEMCMYLHPHMQKERESDQNNEHFDSGILQTSSPYPRMASKASSFYFS